MDKVLRKITARIRKQKISKINIPEYPSKLLPNPDVSEYEETSWNLDVLQPHYSTGHDIFEMN